MKSNLNIKGKVRVESFNEDGILDVFENSNLVVRQGRSNILKVLNAKVSYDNSYIVMDPAVGLFPLVTPPGYWIQYPALGLDYNGGKYLFYIGIDRNSSGASIGSSSIIYDVPGLANKLNTLFSSMSSKTVYSEEGQQIGISSAGMGLFEASVVLKDNGEETIKIACTDNSPGVNIAPYSFGSCVPPTSPSGPIYEQTTMCTVDDFFGPNTIIYQNNSSVTCSNFVISSIQLGTGNEPASVDSNAFPANTYVSPSYPVTAIDVIDPAYPDFITSCDYVAIIPKEEANGEGGTGVTFTEAALKHANGDWFAHVNLGQQYKNDTFGLRLIWTVDLLPQ